MNNTYDYVVCFTGYYISVYGKTFEEKFFVVTKTPPLTENFVVAWLA